MNRILWGACLAASWIAAAALGAGEKATDVAGTFDLGGKRSREERFYLAETSAFRIGKGGKKELSGVTRLFLRVGWKGKGAEAVVEHTCGRFTITGDGTTKEASIPALAGWTYRINDSDPDVVFGIPHEKFMNLQDKEGQAIQANDAMSVYSAFVDFHAHFDFLTHSGLPGWTKDPRRIGDRFTPSTAGTKLPMHFGNVFAKGSTFQVGESAEARLDGIGCVDGNPCALIRFDCGDSRLDFRLASVPGTPAIQGYSFYRGTLWMNLASFWLERCEWDEEVVAGNTTVWRKGEIRSLTREAYEKAVGR